MNSEPQTLETLADQMGELMGQLQASLEAVNQRSGEIMAQLRLNTHEQQAEAAKALQHLQDIASQAKNLHRQLPQRIDDIAKAAGLAQAQAFGEAIAAGIKTQLNPTLERALSAATELKQASRTLRWKTAALFIITAIGFSLIVGLFLWGMTLSVNNDIAAMRIKNTELIAKVEALTNQGIDLDLKPCPGDLQHRTCVRVDTRAPRFGQEKDYAILYRSNP